jgi:hypothetical protein
MDEAEFTRYVLILPALVIVGGVVVMWAGIRHATRLAELQHQERMAMIERGLAPPDEIRRAEGVRRSYGAKMSIGILLCGLGLGFVLLIAFAAGSPESGVGIGGAIVMVGLAFVVSAMFTERQGPSLEERRAGRDVGSHGGGRGGAPAPGAALEPPDPGPDPHRS